MNISSFKRDNQPIKRDNQPIKKNIVVVEDDIEDADDDFSAMFSRSLDNELNESLPISSRSSLIKPSPNVYTIIEEPRFRKKRTKTQSDSSRNKRPYRERYNKPSLSVNNNNNSNYHEPVDELYPYEVQNFRLETPNYQRRNYDGFGFSAENLHEYDLSTYENRLRLDDNVKRPKLTSSEIDKLCCFKNKKKLEEPCVICTEYCEEDQEVITLHCLHSFHKECIITWLKTSRICPICRIDAVHK